MALAIVVALCGAASRRARDARNPSVLCAVSQIETPRQSTRRRFKRRRAIARRREIERKSNARVVMFYSSELLCAKGAMGQIWVRRKFDAGARASAQTDDDAAARAQILANQPEKADRMTRNKTNTISIRESCETIINPPSPLVGLVKRGFSRSETDRRRFPPRAARARRDVRFVGAAIGRVAHARGRGGVCAQGAVLV